MYNTISLICTFLFSPYFIKLCEVKFVGILIWTCRLQTHVQCFTILSLKQLSFFQYNELSCWFFKVTYLLPPSTFTQSNKVLKEARTMELRSFWEATRPEVNLAGRELMNITMKTHQRKLVLKCRQQQHIEPHQPLQHLQPRPQLSITRIQVKVV